MAAIAKKQSFKSLQKRCSYRPLTAISGPSSSYQLSGRYQEQSEPQKCCEREFSTSANGRGWVKSGLFLMSMGQRYTSNANFLAH
jgi:hypothetical protein